MSASRAAGIADLDELLAIEDASFKTDRLSRRSLRRLLVAPTAACLVALVEDRPAGYAIVLFRKTGSTARLYSIAVRHDARGQGLGASLLAAAEGAAVARGMGALRLEVRPDNDAAIALYRACGYRQTGRYADYYADHADALRFEKLLSSSGGHVGAEHE